MRQGLVNLSPESIEDAYPLIFDEKMRTAHTVALSAAIVTEKDRWPSVELVDRVSRIYGVAVDELGAFFGLIRLPAERGFWIDVWRSPEDRHEVRAVMTDEQARAYGFMLLTLDKA